MHSLIMNVYPFFLRKVVFKIEYTTKFDKEFATQFLPEAIWLKRHGIRYTFVKTINGLTTYKYEKNSALFRALAEFYETQMEK